MEKITEQLHFLHWWRIIIFFFIEITLIFLNQHAKRSDDYPMPKRINGKPTIFKALARLLSGKVKATVNFIEPKEGFIHGHWNRKKRQIKVCEKESLLNLGILAHEYGHACLRWQIPLSYIAYVYTRNIWGWIIILTYLSAVFLIKWFAYKVLFVGLSFFVVLQLYEEARASIIGYKTIKSLFTLNSRNERRLKKFYKEAWLSHFTGSAVALVSFFLPWLLR